MRVLVCGGRDFNDHKAVTARLDLFHAERRITTLIHGAARGADTLADDWADYNGVPTLRFPADWSRDGKAAGPIRNQRMLTEGDPECVIAFPGGAGTADMCRRAAKAGIEVIQVSAERER